MPYTDEKVTQKQRKFYSNDIKVSDWNIIEEELNILLDSKINNAYELIEFYEKFSEIKKMIMHERALRYVGMTCHADNKEIVGAFNDFISNVYSKLLPYEFKIKQKFYDSPFRKDLPKEAFSHLENIIAKDIEIFREENVPLLVEEEKLSTKYRQLSANMTLMFKGEEKTLAQMSVFQRNPDRTIREEAWRAKVDRLAQSKTELDDLYDNLKKIRIQIAKNAGFNNYRDYIHKKKGRFGYTPEDLFKFHDAVEKHVIPFLKDLNEERKNVLNIESVRPWDEDVEIGGKLPKPYKDMNDFADKAINILYNVNPEFGIELNKMKNSEQLDLENRKGKAPGGYCTTLHEAGSSFIFMNAVGAFSDVKTLLHESGHSMHSKYASDIRIMDYVEYPSEVAELASMSMEMLSMDYWDSLYSDKNDLNNAKIQQLENTMKFMPWYMIVDSFQHWIYLNPDHTSAERDAKFAELRERFNPGVNWEGLEEQKKIMWMFQLHIFQYPFYYIEYAMSRLGSLAMYKSYKEIGSKAVENYKDFLLKGYTVPVNELYETAGIKFDFSEENIKELVDFIREELKLLKK